MEEPKDLTLDEEIIIPSQIENGHLQLVLATDEMRVHVNGPRLQVERVIEVVLDRRLVPLGLLGEPREMEVLSKEEATKRGLLPPEEPPAPEPEPKGPETIEKFYKHKATRLKGQLGYSQEAMIICAYYLQHIQGAYDFHPDDVFHQMRVAGIEVKKFATHAFMELKRRKGWLQPGDKRGRYRVATKGYNLVKHLPKVPYAPRSK